MPESLRKQTLAKAGYEPDETGAPPPPPSSGADSARPLIMPAMDIYGAMPGQVTPQTQAAPDATPQPPAPPQVPQAPGPSMAELQAAQQWAQANRADAHERADRLRSTMASLGHNPMEVDEGKILAGLNGPLQDLIERQNFAKTQQGMQHQAAQTQEVAQGTQAKAQGVLKTWQDMTPGSPTNKARATHLNSVAQMFGVPGVNPSKFTADQEQPIIRAIEAKANLTGHLAQARAALAETHARNQEMVNEHQVQAGLRQQSIDEKAAQTEKAKAPKALPQPTVEQLDNSLSSLDSIEDLKQKHKAVGLSALSPVPTGANYDYQKAQEATEGQLGKAMFPTTRGTGAAELVRKQEPSGMRSGSSAAKAWDEMHKKIYQEADNHLKTLEANPAIDQTQVQDYRARLESARQKYGIGAPPGFVPGLPK